MTSCATPLSDGQVALLSADLRDLGREGTIFALAEQPTWRPQIETVRDQLNGLANQSGAITVDSIITVLSQLPFEELESNEARLAFTAGRLILRRTGANIDLATIANLKPLAAGLALGITEGLDLQKKLKL